MTASKKRQAKGVGREERLRPEMRLNQIQRRESFHVAELMFPEGCLETAAAAVADTTLALLPRVYSPSGGPGSIPIRASSGSATLYIALRPLSSHPGQFSTIGQPATPVLRPTCMEIRTDSLRSACLWR
jgi:hypothetical protein